MANYENLKASIDAVIRANGQQEITGPLLNQVLKAMVNSLGSYYQFAGVATPRYNPRIPDQNVFYMALEEGTYTYFGNAQVPFGISVLFWRGQWSMYNLVTFGDEVTQDSNTIPTSDAIYEFVHSMTTEAVIVDTLPEPSEDTIHKIYCTPVSNPTPLHTKDEYITIYDEEVPDYTNVKSLLTLANVPTDEIAAQIGEGTYIANVTSTNEAYYVTIVRDSSSQYGYTAAIVLPKAGTFALLRTNELYVSDGTIWVVQTDSQTYKWESLSYDAETEITETLSVEFIGTGGIFAVNDTGQLGEIRTDITSSQYTDYVDISNRSIFSLNYLRMVSTSAQQNILMGLCFYDANKVAISGITYFGGGQSKGSIDFTTNDIPANAAYIRFSCYNEFVDAFYVVIKYKNMVTISDLIDQVNVIDDEVKEIAAKIGINIIEGGCINYTNGEIITNQAYNVTDYIKISGYDKFSIPVFQIEAPGVIGLAFYDRNKGYISGIHYPYKNTYSFIRYIAPAEACYVRFTVLPDTIPYINIESNAPIAPYFNTYLAFNTPQAKGQFKLFISFGNGIMLGSCGNDKLTSNDDVLIYRSIDWGITWAYLGNATRDGSLRLKEGIYNGDHDGNGNAIVGSGDFGEHYLLRITNYGKNFPSDYSVVATAATINNIVGVTTNGVENVVYCGNNTYRAFCNSVAGFTGHNAVIESTNGGSTWHAAASTQPLLASLRSIYRDSKGVLWGAGMLGTDNRGVWKSTDNGLNWTRKSNFLAFQSIIEYNGYLFCGAMNASSTQAYVYRSADDGDTWEEVFMTDKFTPIYHRTFIPYKNALLAVFCQGEGSTSNEASWQISLDNGDSWGEINRSGSYDGGFVELKYIIGDTYYINTHGGLQKM